MATPELGKSKEILEHEAQQELETIRTEHPKDWRYFLLGSFQVYLSNSKDPEGSLFKSYVYNELDPDDWSSTENSNLYFREDKGFSSLRRSQTPEEFFNTVQSVIQELGIHQEEIQRLLELSDKHGYDEARQAQEQLVKLLEPAYVKLRGLGYSRVDLTEFK